MSNLQPGIFSWLKSVDKAHATTMSLFLRLTIKATASVKLLIIKWPNPTYDLHIGGIFKASTRLIPGPTAGTGRRSGTVSWENLQLSSAFLQLKFDMRPKVELELSTPAFKLWAATSTSLYIAIGQPYRRPSSQAFPQIIVKYTQLYQLAVNSTYSHTG